MILLIKSSEVKGQGNAASSGEKESPWTAGVLRFDLGVVTWVLTSLVCKLFSVCIMYSSACMREIRVQRTKKQGSLSCSVVCSYIWFRLWGEGKHSLTYATWKNSGKVNTLLAAQMELRVYEGKMRCTFMLFKFLTICLFSIVL